jgi:uncharacterized protein YjbI with pentapeptide repeats
MVVVSGNELITMLESGVECWNEFRQRHPDTVMLTGLTLADAQLARADLRRAFFIESDLRRANLSFAILERAILRKTNLCGSDLRHANIDAADLCRANLSHADLRDANLSAAFLKYTDLRGADLSTAVGLTDAQVADACGDAETRLPANLARPSRWDG